MGYNPDTTTDRSIVYIWQADKEGVYLFSDMADTRGNEKGTNVHGLFGAIIVEAAGSSWLDPVTGKPIESGLFADIYHPAKPAFREYSVFFHDHLFANRHQQHGMFGALIVEPAGSVFLDPKTGKELKCGTKAVIRTADGKSYREFALFLHDLALLFDKYGKPLNPPEHPGSDDDPGVMGINYRCVPMRERLKYRNDPAHIFSSLVYGDPDTPIFETYPGDPIRIRLLDGAHEEQHVFNITGMEWRKEITDPVSPLVQSQTIGISEAFNIQIDKPYAAGDYLYYSGGIDDLWLGLWGIIRAYSEPHKGLLPLCGMKPIALPQFKKI